MTVELVMDAPPSAVEALLETLLDREWARQSDRTAPLQPTTTVRELVELALATTPGGIFAATVPPAASPRALVESLHDALPEELSGWTLRAMRRATSLRTPQPTLPPAQAPPLLGPPAEAPSMVEVWPPVEASPPDTPPPDATVVEPDAAAPAASAEFPAALPEGSPPARSRPRALTPALAAGVALGAATGGLAMLVSAPDVAVGAVAGLAGAGAGAGVGIGRRG